jgi:hypothetical protein
MRATLRAVLAARRIPRPTPAAKLSGLLGVLRLVVMDRVPVVAVSIRSCDRLPNHPPRADRLQRSSPGRVCIDVVHRSAPRHGRPSARLLGRRKQ